jgi:hypothetical protein
MTIDESFDIGSDLRTSVEPQDYQVPFEFVGKINQVRFQLGPEGLPGMNPRRLVGMNRGTSELNSKTSPIKGGAGLMSVDGQGSRPRDALAHGSGSLCDR